MPLWWKWSTSIYINYFLFCRLDTIYLKTQYLKEIIVCVISTLHNCSLKLYLSNVWCDRKYLVSQMPNVLWHLRHIFSPCFILFGSSLFKNGHLKLRNIWKLSDKLIDWLIDWLAEVCSKPFLCEQHLCLLFFK